VFYQELEDLGTRPRLHLSRRNQSPPNTFKTNSSSTVFQRAPWPGNARYASARLGFALGDVIRFVTRVNRLRVAH